MNETAMLARCRDLHAGIAPGLWTRVHDSDGAMIEAAGEMPGERIVVARFTPYASEAEIEFAVEAPRMVGFLLGLVDRAMDFARAHGRTAPAALASAGAGETSPGGRSAERWRALMREFEGWRVSGRSAPAETERRWRSDRPANAGTLRSSGDPAGGEE